LENEFLPTGIKQNKPNPANFGKNSIIYLPGIILERFNLKRQAKKPHQNKGGDPMNTINALSNTFFLGPGRFPAAIPPAVNGTGSLKNVAPNSSPFLLNPLGANPLGKMGDQNLKVPTSFINSNLFLADNPGGDQNQNSITGGSIEDRTDMVANSGENVDPTAAETQQTPNSNSFVSNLNLLDTNADGLISADELKVGAGLMINSMIQSKDLNGDQVLSAEEAGIPQTAFTQLDTDGGGTLSADELNTEADKIIDGLVSILDTNGDKALSPDELAVFELLFTGQPSLAATIGQESSAVQQAAKLYQPVFSNPVTSKEIPKTVSLMA
jgi:hypothetical protein